MPHGCFFYSTPSSTTSSTSDLSTAYRRRRRRQYHKISLENHKINSLTSIWTGSNWTLPVKKTMLFNYLLVFLIIPSAYGLFPPFLTNPRPLSDLLFALDNPTGCGEVMPAYALLHTAVQLRYPRLSDLAQFFANHPTSFDAKLITNCTFSREPPIPIYENTMRSASPSPAYGLQYTCSERGTLPGQWIPTIVFPSHDPKNANQKAYLTLRLNFEIDLCQPVHCNTKCSWTVHYGLRVLAKQCCDDNSTLCRTDIEHGAFFATRRHMLLLFNALCAISCIFLIPVVWRERRRQHEARGWALMELFLLGASILYSILLLDWLSPPEMGCCIAVWLRQIGFSIFYGSIVLKIYRNLQEYRVRKAQHVSVREKDMVKYLAAMLALTVTGLMAWTVGSWGDPELWRTAWPQCLMQGWHFIWHGYEVLFLLYGMRLCYKARNSDWLERWQFTVAVCLEAVITCVANIIRYWMRNSGHSDTLFTVSFVQLQLTVSVNIVIIIAPKFYLKVSGESTRRSMTLGGHSGRAHPSLAKLRDNILNGTIDFAEVPIVDMNPEDIRAELKRVYTQLRMYKLKNLYQDNPHISKKRGGKKWSDKTGKTRRISIPNCSPQNKRIEEDEKSDLTVESSPHNVYLSTYKLQLEPNHSVRV
ncbi:unnamed protein product [Auanema sp. JU1783]|nr:unnamed protein product [Auanema sp. JU1783]